MWSRLTESVVPGLTTSAELLEKCKAKLQLGANLQRSEWPPLKSLQITNVGEGVEKREPSYTLVGNVSWNSHYGKSMVVPQKLKLELLYVPAIPPLGMYPDKTIIQKDTCTPVFTTALFTITKT